MKVLLILTVLLLLSFTIVFARGIACNAYGCVTSNEFTQEPSVKDGGAAQENFSIFIILAFSVIMQLIV